MTESDSRNIPTIVFILMVLLSIILAGALGAFLTEPDTDGIKLPQIGGDQQDFASESQNASYFIGLSSNEVKSNNEMNLSLVVVNEKEDTRSGKFIIGTSAGSGASMFTKNFSVGGYNSSTFNLRIEPKSVDHLQEYPIVSYVDEREGPTIRLWEKRIRVVPDVPSKSSIWFIVGSIFSISIFALFGAVVNWKGSFVQSSPEVATSLLTIIMSGIGLTAHFWHYFGFIDKSSNGIVMFAVAGLISIISIWIFHNTVN